jgi:hypothetical protein
VARQAQNLPRTFKEPERTQATKRPQTTAAHSMVWAWTTTGLLALAAATLTALLLIGHTNNQAAAERRIDREVSALLAGIPQRERSLGSPTAPVTLQVFLDLKDPDSRNWFLTKLPGIIHNQVRTGALKLEYRAYKTNTFKPQTFVKEQTAALAAGSQNKLWNYIDTFYHEQRSEFLGYVTEPYLQNIARQIPALNLTQWHTDRHTGRREEQTTSEGAIPKSCGCA